MTFDIFQEREKWDEYYDSIPLDSEDETLHRFNREFAQRVLELLPEGGNVLEMGCGSGWQSLALARSGKYQVTLLDFSNKALDHARKLFERENLAANFVLADAFQPGEGKYDLVFNAGVIEHYNTEQQVALLRSMAMRSRKHVMVVAPNRLCEWYWLWRIQASSQANWPFGKEAPVIDLSQAIREAGLNFIGQAFMGENWTESFINGLSGIDDELRQLILDVHRSPLLSPPQKSYLVAGLGSVAPDQPTPAGWSPPILAEEPGTGHLIESVAVALSQIVQEKAVQKQLKADLLAQRNELLTLGDDLLVRQEQLNQSKLELHEKDQAIESLRARLDKELEQYKADLLAHQDDFDKLRLVLREKDQTIDTLSARLNEIFGSTAWALVQKLWTLQVNLRSKPNLVWLERIARSGARKALRRGPSSQQPAPAASTPRPVKASRPSGPLPASTENSIRHQYLLYPSDTRVILLAPTFFDRNGNNMYYGGAERYLIELAHIIRELGYDPVIVQCGNFDWMRYYFDVQVIGIEINGEPEALTREIEKLNPPAALMIYSPFFLASEKLQTPSIGISHGVYWDDPSFQEFSPSTSKIASDLLRSFKAVSQIVSVDTNTINWLRASQSELATHAVYVPNFVDLHQFKPATKSEKRLVVLYPRRLYKPRGFWLVSEILPEILEKYPQVDFHFVGKADTNEEIKVQEWMKQYPDRVLRYSLPPDEMHLAYQRADITLIPTVNSEGTSLSCLEAMASGNAVIATNIGGLTDLIINGLNGLLIEPNASALKNALHLLISNSELRHQLARNGRQVVEQSFTLERWRSHWMTILQQQLPPNPRPLPKVVKTLVFPYTGINWDGIKQRPHHIASEFVKKGYEVFWTEAEGRRMAAPHVHLLGLNDELYLEDALILIYYPYNFEEIRKYKDPVVIYDVLDDISIFDHVTWDEPGKTARDYYARLLERADIVMTSARTLLGKIRETRPDALYVPNGVYSEHFNPANFSVADELKDLHRPIVGFHGAVASWLDVQLLLQVARLRPDYQFVLVGPVSIPDEIGDLKQQKNVLFIDSVPYEHIPAYIKGFDVGIMPFKVNILTNGVRPLKVLEYLSMGKPVVATPIEDLKDWPGVLLATSPEEFAACLDEALHAGGIVGDSQAVARFLEDSAWPEVVRPLMEKLNTYSEIPS